MTTLKTNPLSLLLFLLVWGPQAFAFNEFDCLRDMIPVTAHSALQVKRKGVEQPFMLDDNHMVFAEVHKKTVTGFYVYTRGGSWYYDAIQAGDEQPVEPISALSKHGKILYQMVVQPAGLETVTLYFMPGFDARETNHEGPVMLGASVLPVVGAILSRPEKADFMYQDPRAVSEQELKGWVYRNMSGRKPASVDALQLQKKIVKLRTKQAKSAEHMRAILANELKLREKWVEDRNLDDRTFRSLNHALQTTCKR